MYKLYHFIRIIYWPFLIWVAPLMSRSLRARLAFEKRNSLDLCCRPFSLDGREARVAFEVSSEGELEQVRPVLEELLVRGDLVELVFASDSVEKQCLKLAQNWPGNLRVLRLPLLTYFPGKKISDVTKWLSAKKLVLCRYDFFPSLLAYGARADVQFFLTSASLKSFENKSGLSKKILTSIYLKFDRIVCATELDRERFIEKIGLPPGKLATFDFRPLAIQKRLNGREEKLKEVFPARQRFLEIAKAYEEKKRIVFGSFWEEEASAFNGEWDFRSEFVTIFPHRLDHASLESLAKRLSEEVRAPIYRIGSDGDRNLEVLKGFEDSPGPIIIELKGALLESYPDFGAAFVGGGHGVSVHSLMEPFMAGCFVMCGPRVHRSTEFDLIRESNPDRLQIVDSLPDVYENFKKSWSMELSNNERFIKTFTGGPESAMKFIGL